MDKKEAYRILDSNSCGLEETCLGLRRMEWDLSESSLEYIEEAIEEIAEAVKYLRGK